MLEQGVRSLEDREGQEQEGREGREGAMWLSDSHPAEAGVQEVATILKTDRWPSESSLSSLLPYQCSTVSVLGRDEGYPVKYNPLPEGAPEGKA